MSFRKALSVFGLVSLVMASVAFAQEGGAPAAASEGAIYLRSFGAALALGIAAFGGALGQARAAAAALEGIARNPAAQAKIFTPMIIALALIESLVLYAFVIAILKA